MTQRRVRRFWTLAIVCVLLFSAGELAACAYQTPAAPPPVTPEKSAPATPEAPPQEIKSDAPSAPAPPQPASTQPTPPQQPPAPSQQSSSLNVDISGFAFSPATITAPVGATVTWTNRDSVAHTITSQNGPFGSGQLSRGVTFSYTFQESGTFQYHCKNHPSMTARVIVGSGGASSSGGQTTPPSAGSSNASSGSSPAGGPSSGGSSDYSY